MLPQGKQDKNTTSAQNVNQAKTHSLEKLPYACAILLICKTAQFSQQSDHLDASFGDAGFVSNRKHLLTYRRLHPHLETVFTRQDVSAIAAGRLALLALRNTSSAFDLVGAAGCARAGDSSSVCGKL